ncbi:flagellar hook-associated protein FlgK [Paenibacillus shenyangensis]|uniref:flagellar hook-associated protein FlgK n=1 Tax=Paenibacillus sp. A9 TaxID=1284352 RepID=UPI00037E90B6|nr:flagellar hook-associated protein FlgK [Paenibacillus sp. A9]
MTSTFHSIETAKRSVITQSTALNTTGHNIANANTEGYSRQTVKMSATRPIEAPGFSHSTGAGQIGTGVEATQVVRVRELFLDGQFRQENATLNSWTTRADSLSKIEEIFQDPSETGFSAVLKNFWDSWSDLSKDPDSLTARSVVKENALALTDSMNQISKQLTDYASDLTANVTNTASEVQGYVNSIANLNQSIVKVEALGDDANDLRDQRDLFVDKLSALVNINVTDTAQGYNVSMGGQNLVQGYTPTTVDAAFLNNAYEGGTLTGGEVHGMILSRDTYVASYTNQLNQLANTIANGEVQVTFPKGSVMPEGTVAQVVNSDGTKTEKTYTGANRTLTSDTNIIVKGINGLQQMGYSMDTDANGAAKTGVPFFTSSDNGTLTAGSITVNPDIVNNLNAIATSMRVDANGKVIKGNNDMALITSELTGAKFSNADGTQSATINSFYSTMVGQLGVQAQEANRQTDNSTTIVTQIDSRRQSVSGVSIDEEMSDLLKFQHAYSAAARFMTTYDQLLDKLINSTGLVGR